MSTNVGGAKAVRRRPAAKKTTGTKKPTKPRKGGRAFTYAPFNSESVPEPLVSETTEPLLNNMPSDIPSMDGGAKKKKNKTKRKPGKYALFVKQHYEGVAKANPKWKATDCIKEIAKMWRAKKDK